MTSPLTVVSTSAVTRCAVPNETMDFDLDRPNTCCRASSNACKYTATAGKHERLPLQWHIAAKHQHLSGSDQSSCRFASFHPASVRKKQCIDLEQGTDQENVAAFKSAFPTLHSDHFPSTKGAFDGQNTP